MGRHPGGLYSAVVAAGALASGAGAQPVFRPLGFPAGSTVSVALAISGDGQTVAGTTTLNASGGTAWWWRSGPGMSFIPGTGGQSPERATGVSGDGGVISVATAGFPTQSIRYVTATNSSTVLPFFGGGYFAARCVSADGQSMGGEVSVPPHAHEPGRWDPVGGPFSVPLPPGYDSGAVYAISADGAVLAGWGYAYSWGAGPAFRWAQATGAVSLGFLGASSSTTNSVATGISADGAVIVGWSDVGSDQRGFRWTQAGGMVEIGPVPGASDMAPTGVSADGSVVVGSYAGAGGSGAFIWDQAHGARDLRQELLDAAAFGPLAAWSLNFARAISADGLWVAGDGLDPQGREQAFLVNRSSAVCYANCDGSTTAPLLNVLDFTCFLRRFAAGDAYANCDQSTGSPALDVSDFSCFLQKFASGCP